jgi:ferredoxin--NADP+ reductase
MTTPAENAPARTPVPGEPVLPEVRQHLISPAEPAIARVVATRVCTASAKAAGFVRHVELDVSGTLLENNFRAGQSFGVVPPGTDAQGRPHKLRLYSIASPTRGEDGSGRVLATTVKRTIDEHWENHKLFVGVCSNYLCDLSPGDEVLVTGPAGKRFLLPADPAAHDYVFFATGTGIAPFRGIVMDLARAGFPSRAVLVMGSPYATDLLYHTELEAVARAHPGFRYLTAVSREVNQDCGRRLYVQDRLSTHAAELGALLVSRRTLVYVCGIAGMELGIFQHMARVLGPEALGQYLRVDPAAGPPEAWDRKMIPRLLAPTRRLMLEVY